MVFVAEPRSVVPSIVASKRLEDEIPSVLVESAFRLHSRPGSNRTLALDFDGGLIHGTAWNDDVHGGADVVAQPFDVDGDPAGFSAAERAIVVEIWQRVSEDYAPFDVDVTTEAVPLELIDRSSTGDQQFGTSVMITPTDVVPACQCAGLSYVGVFDRAGDHQRYQPSLVFQSALGSGAHFLAEAAAHEAGHTLGLPHALSPAGDYEGGHGPWAPIMGSSYYRPVTRWLSGEHFGGAGVLDEMAVMAGHGATPAPDDHFDEAYRATALGAGPTVNVEGTISTAGDVDQFGFTTAGGQVVFAAQPASIGANLDLDVRLTTVSGEMIVGADPMVGMIDTDHSSGLDATVSADLAPGSYVVRVAGAHPSDAGGLVPTGRYTLTGSFAVSTNRAPVPQIAVHAAAWAPPAEVHFSSGASSDPDGSIASVSWDFGDGTKSNRPAPTKTYAAAGNYTAVMTVTDNQGAVASAAVLAMATARFVERIPGRIGGLMSHSCIAADSAKAPACASIRSAGIVLDWSSRRGDIPFPRARTSNMSEGEDWQIPAGMRPDAAVVDYHLDADNGVDVIAGRMSIYVVVALLILGIALS